MPVVGAIGNINPIKWHRHILKSISSLDESSQKVVVPLVGEILDSRQKYYENFLSLRTNIKSEDRVRFAGFRSDIPESLSPFDVFVLSSVAETCPMVVLEAMAMVCPVVATDVGGVPEEIPNSDHGWVVPPKDINALAQAITEALGDPQECRRRTSECA